MSKPVDPEKVAAQLKNMQQDLQALEAALRELTDALTEEEEAQLSPEAKAGLKRIRAKTHSSKVELMLPKNAVMKEAKPRIHAGTKKKYKTQASKKQTDANKIK